MRRRAPRAVNERGGERAGPGTAADRSPFTGGHPGTLATRERPRGVWVGALAAAGFCIAASDAGAQPRFFLRVAPEAGRAAVEHTKTVAIRGGSSSSTSPSSGPALAGSLSAGVLLPLPGGWLVGAEIEGVASGRRRLEGTIPPTPDGNAHDVWPGRWELRDLYGAGGQILLGRGLGDGRPQLYFLGGVRGMRTEFASGWTNPATGTPGEDRRHLDRWPWTIGVGTTLPLTWPVDLRIGYARSVTNWIIVQEGARLDYRYTASALVLSAGIRVLD